MPISKQELIDHIKAQLASLWHPNDYLNLQGDLCRLTPEGLCDLRELLDAATVMERQLQGARDRTGWV